MLLQKKDKIPQIPELSFPWKVSRNFPALCNPTNYPPPPPHHHRYLQLRGHVPEADLSVVAAGDDGVEVVHHQQAADAVGGCRAAPQHYGQNQVVP